MWWILLIVLAAFAVSSEEELLMKNLTIVTWAHAVNNKTYLQAALASEVSMLEADIVLGHVSGSEGPPIPIMAHPPATKSDLSLSEFLSTVQQSNKGKAKPKGVKLDFKSIEAFEKSQDLIVQYTKPEPLVVHCRTWDSHKEILSSEDVAILATVGRRVCERSYWLHELSTPLPVGSILKLGKDRNLLYLGKKWRYWDATNSDGWVSRRKQSVNFPIWLNADILPGPVDATTKPVDPAKFLKLATKHPKTVLSIGWTTRFGGNITEGEYSREHIGTMLRMIHENNVRQNVTFPVRAGLASHSQPVLLDLLRETAFLNSSMTVWSSEGDKVVTDRLRALILTVGLERTFLDVPEELSTRLHLPPADRVRN